MNKYKVTLTAKERQELQELIAAGKAAAKKLMHARILLKADAADGGPAWPDDRIAEAVDVAPTPSAASANASSRRGWRRPWSARSRSGPAVNASSTAGPRPD